MQIFALIWTLLALVMLVTRTIEGMRRVREHEEIMAQIEALRLKRKV
jgi:hypothetical protein